MVADLFRPYLRFWDYSTRSRRREYFVFLSINIVLFFILLNVGVSMSNDASDILMTVWLLLFFVPSYIAVAVRRLHDVDFSTWLILVHLVPALGLFIAILINFTDGTPGPNKYGPDPKGRTLAQPENKETELR